MGSELLNTYTPVYEIFIRLVLALALAMVIGLDREIRQKPAGLRTHMLISLAAASFTLLGLELIDAVGLAEDKVRADPIRIIEAVITGVAFLGAGTIIQARGEVRGVTTGAGMWLAGAVGVACGGGFYIIALSTLVLGVVVLSLIARLHPSAERGRSTSGKD